MDKEVNGGNYITFSTYSNDNGFARPLRQIRVYNSGRAIIGGIGLGLFPFVSVIKLRSRRNNPEFFELRNSNNEVMFITDQEGIDVLFENGMIAEA